MFKNVINQLRKQIHILIQKHTTIDGFSSNQTGEIEPDLFSHGSDKWEVEALVSADEGHGSDQPEPYRELHRKEYPE